ncbi:MAG: recombinase family protein [Candidatus Accumulibacter sp.]|jgi:DNA invertase Pin-like site-specific DNA recombinase|nr:recombinase family protein [Accumulibacter sp.]
MPRYFAYLRVSTDGQEVESQKLGLLEYANRRGFAPMELVAETVSRAADWRGRQLGALLEKAGPGDTILTPEFTRLAATPGQVFTFLEAAASKGVIVHITKTGTVMDGSMQSQLLASAFSMASLIELSFIRERTREGPRRAKQEGKRLGRPPGTSGRLKLDEREDEIRGYLAIGLPKRRMAKALGVAYNTLARFIEKKILPG